MLDALLQTQLDGAEQLERQMASMSAERSELLEKLARMEAK